jgi:hypothetical protein
MNLDVVQLNRLLSDARVKGRSAAKTKEAKLALCREHDLLGVFGNVPFHVLEIIAAAFVNRGLDEIDAAALDPWAEREAVVKTVRRLAVKMYETLGAMCCASKTLGDALARLRVWDIFLERLSLNRFALGISEVGKAIASKQAGAKRALGLFLQTGCEECGRARIRKVQWPFLKRWCYGCLVRATVIGIRLRNQCRLDKRFVLGLPYVTRQLYSRYAGAYEARFYLIQDVAAKYSRIFDVRVTTIEDMIMDSDEREAERKLEVKEKSGEIMDLCCSFTGLKPTYVARSKAFASMRWALLDKPDEDLPDLVKSRLETNGVSATIAAEAAGAQAYLRVMRWIYEFKKRGEVPDAFYVSYASKEKILNALQRRDINLTREWFYENVWPEICPRPVPPLPATPPQPSRQPHASSSERFKCPLCPSKCTRTFIRQGLLQHARDVHKTELDI